MCYMNGFFPSFTAITFAHLGLLQSLFFFPQFVDKAPEEIVRGVREKAAETEEKLTLTKNRLAFLQSTVLVSN